MEKENQRTNRKIQIESETSKNDSGFQDVSLESSLFLTNEEEHHSLNELNNRFANYIEHIRNKEFNSKSNKTIEELSEIPSIQLENIKSLYESEIKSLREALDKQSIDLAALTITNNKLNADKENRVVEMDNLSKQIKNLTESLHKSEAANAKLKTQILLIQDNQNFVNNLTSQLKTCQEQLEHEVLLRTASDNACLTYKEKMEFNEAVFKKELGAMMITHRVALEKLTNFKNSMTSSKLFEQMESERHKLKEYLNEFRELVDKNFFNTINKAVFSISNSHKQLSKLRSANDDAIQDQHKLMMELEQIKASHIKLENQISNIETLNEEEINRLMKLVNDLSTKKINELETSFNDLKNLNDSIGEKILLDNELTIYRKMLESEETRTDFISSSPLAKRRKITTEPIGNVLPRKILKPTRQQQKCAIM